MAPPRSLETHFTAHHVQPRRALLIANLCAAGGAPQGGGPGTNVLSVLVLGAFGGMPVPFPTAADRPEAGRHLGALPWLLPGPDDPRPQQIRPLQVSPAATAASLQSKSLLLRLDEQNSEFR